MWAAAYWWSSFGLAALFLLMGARGLWFLRRRPEFVFHRREAYLTAFWILVGVAVTFSLVHPGRDVDPWLALGRCLLALLSLLLLIGLWSEEWKLLAWPTPREQRQKLDSSEDIAQFREWLDGFLARSNGERRAGSGSG
jgi:hypothetical protein